MRNHTAVAKLPIWRPSKRRAGHLRQIYFYVFWLLLAVSFSSMPLLAQSQGDQCSTIGEVKTVNRTVIDRDGAKQIIVTKCTCTEAEDSTGYWDCDDSD